MPDQGNPKSHIEDADRAMGLTPQEAGLYNLHFKNLWGEGGVDNADGSRSTLFATDGALRADEVAKYNLPSSYVGKTFIVPTVKNGSIISPTKAFDNALEEGIEKYPHYDSHEQAMGRYMQMHDHMEKDTEDYQEAMTAGDTDFQGNKE